MSLVVAVAAGAGVVLGGLFLAVALSKDEQELLKPLCLLTIKPAMYVANVAEDGFENNPYLDRLKANAATANNACAQSSSNSRRRVCHSRAHSASHTVPKV